MGYRGYELVKRLYDEDKEQIVGVEVGVFKGKLSAYLLHEMPNLYLNMVDFWTAFPPEENIADDYHHTLTQTEMDGCMYVAGISTLFAENRRKMWKGKSVDMAKEIEDESLDFVFIDAGHTYEECLEDLEAWYPKVKKGGLISGHDYLNPVCSEGVEDNGWGVKQAVDEFTKKLGVEYEVGSDFTYFFTKDK